MFLQLTSVMLNKCFGSIGAKPTGTIPLTEIPQWTCPMISITLPGDTKVTVITDSANIADFLDTEPALNGANTPKLFPPGTRELQDAFIAANVLGSLVTPGLFMLGLSGSAGKLHPVSEAYFRRTRTQWRGGNVAWFGERAVERALPLEEWVPLGSEHREKAWEQVKVGWGRVASDFKKSKADAGAAGVWLTGGTPVYTDLVLLAWVTFLKHAVTEKEWDDVLEWDDGLWKAIWEAGAPFRANID
ncbi:hypothetical protein BKA62DRAFT_711831 [Auriculariales sp. MPI-PUGE-AT-0066]|nr:hypothetical protein BKA62DRAFT_711831 [Auriculariales sp. MPI-PUGE-AT-0066]